MEEMMAVQLLWPVTELRDILIHGHPVEPQQLKMHFLQEHIL
jgi:hypothetical protein